MSSEPAPPPPPPPLALVRAVRELEAHAAEMGWDQPAQLYALVGTAELIAREPGLAAVLTDAAELTPVQQDELPADQLEIALQQIVWPGSVAGAAAVVERLVLPPDADGQVPEDPAAAASYAAEHPDRQEVRIVAAVDRTGASWCALRLRSHDDPDKVLEGAELVPGLVDLLRSTLEDDDV